MTTPATPSRDLSVHTSPDFQRGLPTQPTHWTLAELERWHAQLLTRPWVNKAKLQVQWDRMLEARQNRLVLEVPYPGHALPPPEVVQELPLPWLATRAWSRAPILPLLGHELALVCEQISATPGRGSQVEAEVVGSWLTRLTARRNSGWVDNTLVLAGGLTVQVREGVLQVRFADTEVAAGAATRAQGRHLRRLVSRWQRLVRQAVASELRLGFPAGPSLATPAELVLPVHGAPGYANAFVIEGGRRLACVHRTVVHDTNHYADGAARHALAGAMLRRSASGGDFGRSLQHLLADQVFAGCPVRRLRPAAALEPGAPERLAA